MHKPTHLHSAQRARKHKVRRYGGRDRAGMGSATILPPASRFSVTALARKHRLSLLRNHFNLIAKMALASKVATRPAVASRR